MTSGEEPDGATRYAAFVEDLLTAEDARRASLESRGASVITVTGTLVTLLLGLAALAMKEAATFTLTPAARDRLAYAVIAFVVAALCAIATAIPQTARVTDATQLQALLPDLWEQDADFARKNTTATRLDQLVGMQRTNDRKALALLAAMIAQVAAILLLAWAVLAIV